VRVKICGLTREEDVAAAVCAGADAVGLVFYPGSKRAVTLEQAMCLRAHVPAFVTTVALFVNATPEAVQRVVSVLKPDLLQFHGDETPAYCAAFSCRYLKAFRVGAPGLETAAQLAQACMVYGDAAGWLFDTWHTGYGGSGTRFDLALLHDVLRLPQRRAMILAGGLTPDNVAQAVAQVQPWAVDVSSGVEVASGVKSADRIRHFVQAVK